MSELREPNYSSPEMVFACRTFAEYACNTAVEINRLKSAIILARTAIRDSIRRPLGVEPDSATEALRMIDEVLGRIDTEAKS